MSKMELRLDTLADFDFGKAAVAFKQALAQVVKDCLDRPGDKTARKVVLTTIITPEMAQDGDVVNAQVHFEVKAAVPNWKTAPRPVLTGRAGQLIFNDMAPDNPHQQTIDEEEEQEAAE